MARNHYRFPRFLSTFALTAGVTGVGLTLGEGEARAQDPTPTVKEPNVLIIVDSSGSMEYMMGHTLGADGKPLEPFCDPNADGTSERNRWTDLVEVLGGTIQNFRCETVDRRATTFPTAFALPDGTPPSDSGYRTAYHRPMSGSCQVGPGTFSGSNAFAFFRPGFNTYGSATNCASSFIQAGDGLIDAFTSLVRFGLMTMDPHQDPGTGHTGASAYSPLWSTGSEGGFSYFVGNHSKGHPLFCSTEQDMEVGVRNGAAPAWEGKMIAFGDPQAGSQASVHAQIKDVLLSTRSYGPSPVAGALEDAMAFLWADPAMDPLGGSFNYSPYKDPYVDGGCRSQHIILLTDGEPNMDLRPHCEGTVNPGGTPASVQDGICPYGTPADVIKGLRNGTYTTTHQNSLGGKSVYTHVIGFANPTTKLGTDCTALTDADITSPTGLCATNPTNDPELDICCNLHEMAYYGRASGTTDLALFANDKLALRSKLAQVLGTLVKHTASGTQPVRSPGIGTQQTGGVKALRLLTSYTTNSQGLWQGNIERMRWTCSGGLPIEEKKDISEGDDFNHNVSKDSTSLNNRAFITFVEPNGKSSQTLRPLIGTVNDGLGQLGGDQKWAKGASIANNIPYAAVAGGQANPTGIPACTGLTSTDFTGCRDRIVQWALGYAADHTGQYHRCSTPGGANCSVLGDVLHSTPVLVNRPDATVSDETYDSFIANNSGRPMMAYTSTNDGQMHGFMMSPNAAADVPASGDQSNEKFSFIPPAVLPLLASQYPTTRLKLLDGVATVQDVVASAASGASASIYPFKLERDASAAKGASNTWRTILVQGFGEASRGYFALDVTDVNPATNTGPRFLWQITTDDAVTPTPIFGKGGMPLITTVNMVDGGVLKEVAVAILPGGESTETAGACNRISTSADWQSINAGYTPRTRVRCYSANDPSRSLTVVRLDSGEILRTFRVSTAAAGTIPNGLVTVSPLDSPLTGAPAAYPAGTGAIADRVFIGDRDGTLWKLDLSNTTPSNWKMSLFFDTFAAHPEKATRPDGISQPIVTRPALSVDARGQLTVAVATGVQNLAATFERQYVWSLLEKVDTSGSGFTTEVNWYVPLGGGGVPTGEHVLGPLQLASEVLYFSTYTPPDQTNAGKVACSAGEGAIYGMHYLNAASPGNLSLGGAAGFKPASGSLVTKQTAAQLGLDPSSIIFGVNLEFAPSCSDTSSGSNTYIPGGKAAKLTPADAPQMQLTFQTTSAGGTNKANLNFLTNFGSVNLDQPKIASSIQSWAAILD